MKLSGKKVLITGADGFIGSHLTEELVKLGAEVTALVQYNSFNNWGNLEFLPTQIKNSIKVVLGDIREFDHLKSIIKGNSVVFHLAALIAIPYSYLSPMAYIKTNIQGTANVLEACKDANVEKILHSSTSETYGSAKYVPIDEMHPLQGQSPYAASKIGADKIAESYYLSFNTPVVIVRPFNTYGPRQSARAIIPTILSQIITGKKEIELGNLYAIRDFNYVLDTVNGFIKIAENKDTNGEVYNVCSGQEISIGELVSKIRNCVDNTNFEIVTNNQRVRPEKSEVTRLLGNNSKIISKTDWQPKYTLEDGLKITYEWIKHNLSSFKGNMYTV